MLYRVNGSTALLTAAANIIDLSMRHMIHPPSEADALGTRLNSERHQVSSADRQQRNAKSTGVPLAFTTSTAAASPPAGVPVTHSVDWYSTAAQARKGQIEGRRASIEDKPGILMEICECWSGVPGCYQGWSQWPPAGCSMDQLQFKGVWMRHAMYFLQTIYLDDTKGGAARTAVTDAMVKSLEAFIQTNAERMWTAGACTANPAGSTITPTLLTPGGDTVALPLFGVNWAGTCEGSNGSPSAPTQISALDLVNAHQAIECQGVAPTSPSPALSPSEAIGIGVGVGLLAFGAAGAMFMRFKATNEAAAAAYPGGPVTSVGELSAPLQVTPQNPVHEGEF
jgi:hypothetical protein